MIKISSVNAGKRALLYLHCLSGDVLGPRKEEGSRYRGQEEGGAISCGSMGRKGSKGLVAGLQSRSVQLGTQTAHS